MSGVNWRVAHPPYAIVSLDETLQQLPPDTICPARVVSWRPASALSEQQPPSGRGGTVTLESVFSDVLKELLDTRPRRERRGNKRADWKPKMFR